MKKIIIGFILLFTLVLTVLYCFMPRISYKLDDDEAYITDSIGIIKKLEIKDKYKEALITEVKERAFYKSNYLKEVILGENIVECYKLSFANCKMLENFTFNSKLVYPGNNMFKNDEKLKNVSIPADSRMIEISGSMFYGCESLESISIPGSVLDISSLAFMNCTELREITLYSSLESIMEDAFFNTPLLEKINIIGNNENYLNWIAIFKGKEISFI